jgi:hypothetical protein
VDQSRANGFSKENLKLGGHTARIVSNLKMRFFLKNSGFVVNLTVKNMLALVIMLFL